MPRASKGPRLREKRGLFYIRDGKREIATGTRDRQEAQTILARYVLEKERPTGPNTPDQITVDDVLRIYGEEHAPHVKDPERIGHAIVALVPILGNLPVGSINGSVCRLYAEKREKKPGTTRKELGTLAAAINYCHAEGYKEMPSESVAPS